MTDVKQLIIDLYNDNGLTDKANGVTDDFVKQVDEFYKGDYKQLISDLYDDNGLGYKKQNLTDEFMSGVEQYYGLKKKIQASPSVRAVTEPLQAFQTGLEGRTPEQKEEAKEAIRGISPLAYAEPIPYDVAATISDLKAQLEPSLKELSKSYTDMYTEETMAHKMNTFSGKLAIDPMMSSMSGVSGTFIPSAELAQLEKQWKNTSTAYKLLKDAEKWLAEPAEDKAGKTTWVGRFISGIGNADWADILTLGANGLEHSLNIASIASKANAGGVDSLDDDEYSALVAYGLLQQAKSGDKSIAYQGGRMVAEMIPFIIQFAYTGGIAEGGKQVAKQALKGMGKLGEKAITKALVKAGVTVGTGAIRSTLGVSAPAAVAERMAGQVSLSTNEAGKTVIDRVDVEPVGEAAVKGLASNAAEFIFENAGKALGFIGKTKVGRWMGGIVPDSKVVDRISSTIGYNGFIGEVVEELGTAYAQAGITGDKPILQAVRKDDLMLILVGTASMSGTMNAMKYGVAGAQAMSNSLRRRSEGLRPDLIQQINIIVEGDPDRVAEKLQELVNTEVSSKEELDKVVSYASALIVDIAAQETAGLGAGQDVMVEGTVKSKKLAIDAINDNNAYIGALLEKAVVSNKDLATIQELEEENERLTASLEDEVSNRFGKEDRIAEIRAELDAMYTGDVSGVALQEQAAKEQGLRDELAGLLREKRKVREAVVSDYVGEIAPEKVEPIQPTTEGEKVAETAEYEAKKADIEIGKVGDTEYEVKADGVYYKGKKLDNPENKTYRQLIEADIRRRWQEELKERVVYDRFPTVEDGEFKIIGDPTNRIYRINETTGRPQELDESNGLWSNTALPPNLFMESTKRSGFEKSKKKINAKYEAELEALKQTKVETPTTNTGVVEGSVGVGGAKIKLDPDLANIDPIIIAARNGDKKAQEKLEEYGLDWEQTTTYRFVGQSEVDVLLANNKVESKRGTADAGIDVTTSSKVTSAANNEYRVTFKESFDLNNGLGKVILKSKEEGDHHLEKGRGYDINDVAKIERIDENGNVIEVVYEQSLKETTKAGSVGVELKKEGVEYGEQTKRDIDSRYIDPRRRGEILDGLAGDAEFIRQGGGNLREVVEQSRQRHKEYTERVSHAKKVREEVEVAGQEEGLEGQEGEPVRVREPKEGGVEAQKGEALAVAAAEEEDVASFSMEEVIPEFTSIYTEQIDKLKKKLVKHEEVKSTLQEFIKSKKKEIDKADSRRGRYVSELIASATPRTLERRMAAIERILSNDAYAKKVMDTSAKLKKLQAKVKGAKADYDAIKDVALKAKVTRKGQNLSTFINGIDASELPDAMLDDLSTLVDDLSKRVPDARNLKSFVNAYKGVLQNAADMAMVSNAADAKDAKAIERRVGKIKEKLDELTSVEAGKLDVSQIRSLKREATALASALDNMVKNGDISVTEDGVDIVNETLSPIADILNNDVNALGAEVSEAIAKAEQQYKKETGKRILSKNVSGKAITEEDGKMLSELYDALKQVVANDRALGVLSSYDMDIIEQAVTQVEEAGLVPTKLYQITNKVKAANRYRLAQDGVFDLLEAEEGLSKAAEAFLKMTPKGKEEKLGLVSDITTGQVVGIAKRIRGVMNNPIYNYITNVGSQAIIRAEGLVKDVMTPVFNAVNKGRRTGVGGVIKTYVYDTGVSRGDLKPYDRVGILMNQLQFVSNLKSPKGRVVAQADGTFTVVDANGEAIKENKKTKKFTSAADAIDFLSTLEPEMLTNGRALDYFDIVNYDYVDGQRVPSQSRRNAKLSKKDMVNDNELAHFDDAYAQLVDRLRKQKNDNTITDLSSVRTEEDVKALMDAHELEVYNEIRNAFDSLYDKASAVAARDGKVLDKVDFYFTMMNKSSRFDKVENTGAMIDGIFSAFGKGKMPQLTGSIQERSNMIHYVDFNALRVLESYVRDMAVSYEVMPVIAEQMEALKIVMNEYSKGIGKAANLQKKQRMQQVKEVAEALRENVRSGYIIEYNRQKLIGDVKLPVGKKKYVDVSRVLSHVSNNVKNVVLNKAGRIPLDVIPNSVKLGVDALRFKNPQEKANWLTFFTHNRGSIPSLKVDEMVNKYSMGGYEGFVQKGDAQALADSWSGIGDNMTAFNAWTSKFPKLYKQLSGEEFDIERYISDEAYRNELNASDAFQQAKSMADGYVEEHTVPQTQYANRKAMNAWITRLKPTDKLFKLFQPMSVYTAKDAEAFYANMTDAIMNSNAGFTDAIGRVGRIVVSNLAFNAMSQLFFGLNTYLAGAMKDDELLKEVAKDRMNVFAGEDIAANAGATIITLLLGKQMNLGRILMSAMYNVGKTGYVYWEDNKAIENRRLKKVKNIERGSGIGKALMPIDLTSENIPTETAANILLPFYGQQFVKYVASGKNMVEEMYNASAYLSGDKEARTLDEQNMWSTINSANMLLFSLVNPASSDVRQISDMMMKEYEEYGISKEVLMASLYADDFILTSSDVNERYDAMYERSLKANLRKGLSQEEAETMARKRAEAVVDVFRGEYDGDNGKRMDFYMLNKASIDMFRKSINVVSKSRMGKAEREKWYKVINESYADMYDKYEQYAAGKNVAYTVPNEIVELMAGKTVDDAMVRIYKSVYMLERMGK